MRLIELERGKPLELVIREAVEAGMTWDALAADLGVTRLTLRDWKRRLGCEVTLQRSVTFRRASAIAAD
jgi:transposase-like protein